MRFNMKFPYPINDQLFQQILAGSEQYPIDEPEQFWAFFLSCFDCSKHDGGRLTETVQKRLRALIDSQLFRDDATREILGSRSTLPLQFSATTFCLVGVATDAEGQAQDHKTLRTKNALMPAENVGAQRLTLHPNDKPMPTQARNVYVPLLNRTTAANNLHLGWCLTSGLSNLIAPDLLEKKVKNEERFDLAAKYDNVAYNPYLKQVSVADPSADAIAIKRAAATRHVFEKGGAILKANLQNNELTEALSVLEDMAPNGNRQTFKTQAAATAIPDPSRVLRDACPSDSTLEKVKPYLSADVYGHWVQASKKAPAYFINDFVSADDNDDPYDPKRLRFPVSSTFVGHLSVEKVAKLPLSAKPGLVGRDNYQEICVSLPELIRPGMFLYPHELFLGVLSGIAFRFGTKADFTGFMKEVGNAIITAIEKGQFNRVLSGQNFAKVFKVDDASEETVLTKLKQLAYFDFAKFQADYLCDDKYLETAYLLNDSKTAPGANFAKFTQELEQLWQVSLPTIKKAVHDCYEQNRVQNNNNNNNGK